MAGYGTGYSTLKASFVRAEMGWMAQLVTPGNLAQAGAASLHLELPLLQDARPGQFRTNKLFVGAAAAASPIAIYMC